MEWITNVPCDFWSREHGLLREPNKILLAKGSLIDEGEIILISVPSEELAADMLTKATIGAKFKSLRAKLLGQDE